MFLTENFEWPDFARNFGFFKVDYLFDRKFLSERIYFLLDTENAIK